MSKEKNKKITITGSIVVEFEISSEFLNRDELIDYMKNQLEQALTKEWQESRCYPNMETFNCDVE